MNAAAETIRRVKERLGEDLLIQAHHYQREEVIRHSDHRGDSLELARRIPGTTARTIVFCGVSFMAETAAILAGPERRVFMPAPEAGCSMSNMAPAALAEAVYERLRSGGRRVIPLAYVNTSAAVKALCGRAGGAVCTSANAKTMLAWALRQGDGVLFLPDRNLAVNTADRLDIPDARRLRLNIRGRGEHIDLAAAARADLLIWPGACCVHEIMGPEHVAEARRRDPEARVIVHPECPPATVRAADAAGSTSGIIAYCAETPAGATVYVGTEINLVERLAAQYRGEKHIRPLTASRCVNMAKTTEESLAAILTSLDTATPERVSCETADQAKTALARMLEACA
ncbi:MAG: quinolinate synthase NadA [Thermodesulfobacteriota bacterium]